MEKCNSAVILAGGRSTRMGFDKQFLAIDEVRIIDKLINHLKIEFEEIIIVTNKPEHYEHYDCKIVSDEIKNKGPLGGIHAGLKASKSQFSYFLACDMPNINIEYIKYLKTEIAPEYTAVVTKCGNWIEPFNAFYSKDIISSIEEYILEDRKSIYNLLKNLSVNYIPEAIARKYDEQWRMFSNLNYYEDVLNIKLID